MVESLRRDGKEWTLLVKKLFLRKKEVLISEIREERSRKEGVKK